MALAYNPRRTSAPRRLFTPLNEEELGSYRPQNPLRQREPPPPALFSRVGRPAEQPPQYAPPSPVLMDPFASVPPQPDPSAAKKRKLSSDQQESLKSPKRRLASPSAPVKSHVADHYNSRPNTDVNARQESPIIALRQFNNWAKSVLISKFAARNTPSARSGRRDVPNGLKVLDLGCGKGGDLQKWSKAGTDEYIGLDLAHVSVDQARVRYSGMRAAKFKAKFETLDCFTAPIISVLNPEDLRRPFDIVSMQFCMHYAFESEENTRCMLQNVSEYLDVGGTFIGTIPNPELLISQLDQVPADVVPPRFGNSVYAITFDAPEPRPLYGTRYKFFLRDAVDDVPEYVVFWEPFVQLAAEYGLHLLYREEFHTLYMQEQNDPEYGQLLQRMKVVNADGDSSMTAEQWEATNLYIAFAFVRK